MNSPSHSHIPLVLVHDVILREVILVLLAIDIVVREVVSVGCDESVGAHRVCDDHGEILLMETSLPALRRTKRGDTTSKRKLGELGMGALCYTQIFRMARTICMLGPVNSVLIRAFRTNEKQQIAIEPR